MNAPVPMEKVGPRRAAFGFVFVSAVTTAMSFGLMIPIMPALLKQFTGGDTAQAAVWNTVFMTSGGLMSFFAGPVLGLFSDRFGRRPVLMVSLTGLGIDFLMMAFAPNLWWLFVGRLISGATSGAFSTANAYVADVTAPENRARAFGFMGSAFSFGFLAGPAVGGILGDAFGLRAPFIAAACLTLVNVLYGAFVLPESLAPERRAARFLWSKANPIGALNLLRSHHELLGLAGVYFLNQASQAVWPAVFVLYTGYRYHWTPSLTGFYMMAGGVLGVAVQSFVVGPTVRRFGERGTLLIGGTAAVFAFFWYGSAPTGWWYAAGMPISCLSGLVIPGLQGLMTRRVGSSEQGQLQGANQSLMGLSGLVAPSLFGLSFAWAVDHPALGIPGLPLWIAGVCMTAALALALKAAPRVSDA
ncbi:MAG TPA: TCR/Tet family MFS transporter [Caulobacteraceae bacterium]|jgi:DHA1 family tetracycline resistance protein-like MFS transporter|nr:TCR/Tet family MFS transporter [Caulobacteraceae bacterium]